MIRVFRTSYLLPQLSSVLPILHWAICSYVCFTDQSKLPFEDTLTVYVSLISRLTSHYPVSLLPLIFWLAPCLKLSPTYYIWLTLSQQPPASPHQCRFRYNISPQPIKTQPNIFSSCVLKIKSFYVATQLPKLLGSNKVII